MADGERRRFQNTSGTHFKFYEIHQEGRLVHIRYGRIGTGGTTYDRDLTTEHRASSEFGKLVAEKLGKGYVETTLAGVPFVRAGTERVAAGDGVLGRVADASTALGRFADRVTGRGGHRHRWRRDSFTDKHCLDCQTSVRAEDSCRHPEFYRAAGEELCATCGWVRDPADNEAVLQAQARRRLDVPLRDFLTQVDDALVQAGRDGAPWGNAPRWQLHDDSRLIARWTLAVAERHSRRVALLEIDTAGRVRIQLRGMQERRFTILVSELRAVRGAFLGTEGSVSGTLAAPAVPPSPAQRRSPGRTVRLDRAVDVMRSRQEDGMTAEISDFIEQIDDLVDGAARPARRRRAPAKPADPPPPVLRPKRRISFD